MMGAAAVAFEPSLLYTLMVHEPAATLMQLTNVGMNVTNERLSADRRMIELAPMRVLVSTNCAPVDSASVPNIVISPHVADSVTPVALLVAWVTLRGSPNSAFELMTEPSMGLWKRPSRELICAIDMAAALAVIP